MKIEYSPHKQHKTVYFGHRFINGFAQLEESRLTIESLKALLDHLELDPELSYNAVCAHKQHEVWGPLLEEMGFRLVYRGQNANVGNVIHTYMRSAVARGDQ